jgi:hypothetical protein
MQREFRDELLQRHYYQETASLDIRLEMTHVVVTVPQLSTCDEGETA